MLGKLALLAPFGAVLAAIYSALTGSLILHEFGTAIEANHTPVLPSGQIAGAAGLVLLGAGTTSAAWAIGKRRSCPIKLLFGATLALAGGATLVAYGNWQLMAAFQT